MAFDHLLHGNVLEGVEWIDVLFGRVTRATPPSPHIFYNYYQQRFYQSIKYTFFDLFTNGEIA
jgi:hypothetical protein